MKGSKIMNVFEECENYLRNEGFNPIKINDGLIRFKAQGLSFLMSNDVSDPQFFRIIALFDKEQFNASRMNLLEAANKVNSEKKVVKVSLIERNVFITTELFLDSTPVINDFFERLIDILSQAILDFRLALNQH
jgi:hypothetical protein